MLQIGIQILSYLSLPEFLKGNSKITKLWVSSKNEIHFNIGKFKAWHIHNFMLCSYGKFWCQTLHIIGIRVFICSLKWPKLCPYVIRRLDKREYSARTHDWRSNRVLLKRFLFLKLVLAIGSQTISRTSPEDIALSNI